MPLAPLLPEPNSAAVPARYVSISASASIGASNSNKLPAAVYAPMPTGQVAAVVNAGCPDDGTAAAMLARGRAEVSGTTRLTPRPRIVVANIARSGTAPRDVVARASTGSNAPAAARLGTEGALLTLASGRLLTEADNLRPPASTRPAPSSCRNAGTAASRCGSLESNGISSAVGALRVCEVTRPSNAIAPSSTTT